MIKVYNVVKFRHDLKTKRGMASIFFVIVSYILPLALCYLVILKIFKNIGYENWREVLKRFADPTTYDARYDFIAVTVLILIIVHLFTIFLKKYLPGIITLTDDTIAIRYPISKLYVLLRRKSLDATIQLDKLEKIRSDLSFQGSELTLFTIFESGTVKIAVLPGFIGYFDILSGIEMRCPKVFWDDNTRRIFNDYRQGKSLFRTESLIKKDAKKRLEKIVPSWLKRSLLYSKARREGIIYFSDLMQKAERED